MLRKILFLIFMPCFYLSLIADTPQNIDANSSSIKAESGDVTSFPFTGKISGSKVRIRLKPDLESPVVCQLNKNDLLLVNGENNEFYSITPPKEIKAYVFRSFILDNAIEAERVNVRLHPDLEAPIIAQLSKGDKVYGNVSSIDNKWLEISIPKDINFYVAKDFLLYGGGSDYFAKMEKRKDEAKKLLNSAYFLTTSECKKPFDEMSPSEAISQFEALIKGYTEFPDFVQAAKEGLSLLQDNYLQKKIAFLENKANISESEKDQLFTKLTALSKSLQILTEEEPTQATLPEEKKEERRASSLPEHQAIWVPVEEELFQTWTTYNPKKSKEDFYNEQKANATKVQGVVYSFEKNITSKPGNYVLKQGTSPIAFLYSTQVDLEEYVGKEVSLMVSPRPNNHFAFPAYFVNEIDE